MSRSVVVAVDGQSSQVAVDHALERAADEGLPVRIVGLPGPLAVGMVHASVPDGSMRARRSQIAALCAAARRRGRELGVEVTILSLMGPPDEELLREACACGAGAVVVEGAARGPRWRRPRGLQRLQRDLYCELDVVAAPAGAADPVSRSVA